jgi:hypothetical protein
MPSFIEFSINLFQVVCLSVCLPTQVSIMLWFKPGGPWIIKNGVGDNKNWSGKETERWTVTCLQVEQRISCRPSPSMESPCRHLMRLRMSAAPTSSRTRTARRASSPPVTSRPGHRRREGDGRAPVSFVNPSNHDASVRARAQCLGSRDQENIAVLGGQVLREG